jgi:SAM-dependent methyltransferase
MDPIAQFKEQAKATWSNFAVLESYTALAAPRLLKHAHVSAGVTLLDVACGTGVVALSAARMGARVTGVDLTPELIARAKENAAIMTLEGQFLEGDVEALPLPDASFDVVLSQFGHMFAPRPDVAIKEMLRVLKPGGTIAFSTWPPEHYTGRMFAIMGRYSPAPPPAGVSPPPQWGDPNIVRERLGDKVKGIAFGRGVVRFPTLSVQHQRIFGEKNFAPMTRLLAAFDASDPAKAATLRRELDELAAEYFEDNSLVQDFLLTRATKV